MGRDGTEAEWLEMRGILAHQIAYFETGNQVTPINQDPAKATAVSKAAKAKAPARRKAS